MAYSLLTQRGLKIKLSELTPDTNHALYLETLTTTGYQVIIYIA